MPVPTLSFAGAVIASRVQHQFSTNETERENEAFTVATCWICFIIFSLLIICFLTSGVLNEYCECFLMLFLAYVFIRFLARVYVPVINWWQLTSDREKVLLTFLFVSLYRLAHAALPLVVLP